MRANPLLSLPALSLLLLWVAQGSADSARSRDSLFEQLSGSWSGGGTAQVRDGGPQYVRCQISYTPYSPAQLRLSLRCAGDSFNLQVDSAIARQGNAISGNWSESSTGASGQVSGYVGNNQMQATIEGPGIAARLSLRLRGNAQAVSLESQGQFEARASLTLRRL